MVCDAMGCETWEKLKLRRGSFRKTGWACGMWTGLWTFGAGGAVDWLVDWLTGNWLLDWA